MIGSNIKNIVFDMGRVLLDYDPVLVARHMGASEEESALIKKHLFGSEEWILLDKGTITEEEALERIQERLPNERMRKLAKECLSCWHEYNISSKPGMEAVVRDLKAKGYRMYICSNASLRFRTFQNEIPGFSMMEGALVSAEEKLLKPDPAIYRRLFEKFQIRPEESFFIDDLQENIDGAKACGMAGYCFADGDVVKLRKELGI